jgi:hypothetical protein
MRNLATLKRASALAWALLLIAAIATGAAEGAGSRHRRVGGRSMLVAASDQADCMNGDAATVARFMVAHHASVMRLIIPRRGVGQGLGCVRQMRALGYRVFLSLQYDNAWGPKQVAGFFARALPQYASYLWAVSLGNEQDLPQGAPARSGRVCRLNACGPSNHGQEYTAVWDAVWPVMARIAPRAIRVYGEVSPWGLRFLKQGIPGPAPAGVGAIAFHCYRMTNKLGLAQVPQIAAWAASKRLPLWCSEMSPVLNAYPACPHLAVDTPASWTRRLAGIVVRSPALKLVSFYHWPSIGT